MFEPIEAPPLPGILTYIFHWLLSGPAYLIVVGLLVVLIVPGRSADILFVMLAPLGAGALGYFVNRKSLNRTAVFIFIPALLLFADGIYDDAKGWSPATSTTSRLRFVVHNAFGLPGCEGDCFGGIGAALLFPARAYSTGAFVALKRRRILSEVVRESPLG